ncbi:hypothetical protein, partial [Thioalkalivibrio sp.]|uniref:hypothetical protein n=1 Tax=Thioalkalivibrio sp. TaxID=2093813 RepID=UPI0025DECB9D
GEYRLDGHPILSATPPPTAGGGSGRPKGDTHARPLSGGLLIDIDISSKGQVECYNTGRGYR